MSPPRPAPARRIPAAAFPLAAAAIYAVALTLGQTVPAARTPGPLAWGLLADLLVTVPALWYLLMVRGRGVPARSLVPVVAVSFVTAGLVLPPAIRPGAMGLEFAIAALELAAIVVLGIAAVRSLRRARADAAAGEFAGAETLPEQLSAAARRMLGWDRIADLVAFEVATLAYAFAGWRMKTPADPGAFTSHRESGWSAAAVGLALVLVIETFPVHLLAERASPALAWALTAGSLYALLWLLGDFHALRLRPTRFTGDALLVRLGMRWSARVPWALVREIRTPRANAPAEPKRGALRAVLLGEATVVLDLSEPVVAVGPYGMRRRVTRIELAPDDRRGFERELHAALAASH